MKNSARTAFTIIIAVLFFCLFAFSTFTLAFHECSDLGCCTVCKTFGTSHHFSQTAVLAAAVFALVSVCAKIRVCKTSARSSLESLNIKLSE